jgi:hypothetical protein
VPWKLTDATTIIYVCTTCRRPEDPETSPRPGAGLASATIRAAENTNIDVRPLRCLANCKRGCTAVVKHEGAVWHVIPTGDGRVVTGGWDGWVYCARLDGGPPALVVDHEIGASHMQLVGDDRVVTGGRDGRVYCSPLDGSGPVLIAQHEGELHDLALIGDRQVVSAGEDALLFVSDLSASERRKLFVADLALTRTVYDVTSRILVAADAGGSVHVLPLG